MTDTFAQLAAEHGLKDQARLSPDDLPERYLYSPDMVFRYAFGRWWGNVDLATTAIWVLLNPATGDTEQRVRPTLERCISRSRAAGYTGLVIVNLFAFRDTKPKNLRSAPDPVGPANDEVLRVITKAGARTIAAWARTAGYWGAQDGSDPCWTRRCVWVSPSEANHGTRSTYPQIPGSSLGCRCIRCPTQRTQS